MSKKQFTLVAIIDPMEYSPYHTKGHFHNYRNVTADWILEWAKSGGIYEEYAPKLDEFLNTSNVGETSDTFATDIWNFIVFHESPEFNIYVHY